MASGEHPMFELWKWVLSNTGTYHTSLAGSAATPLSIDDLINLSTDPETTRKSLAAINTIPLGLGQYDGDPGLRANIAAMYDDAKLGAGDVVVTNATTGANALVFQSLLRAGDHVVALYPCYNQLLQFPAEIMGLEVSHWRLDPNDGWDLDIADLRALIRPGRTKMLVLNNPHNPTGRVLGTAFQRQIVDVAKEHSLIVFCDEIFRPLFHGQQSRDTTSLVHHTGQYDKIIVTGSLSKPYGLSGTRIGWAVTRSQALREKMIRLLPWTLSSVSVTDEIIAREALSPRLRQPLLDITLQAARENLRVLREVVEDGDLKGRLDLRMPEGGGTAFMRVLRPGGKEAVDDVQFCHGLRDREGVLLAPGSKTFGVEGAAVENGVHGGKGSEFRGFVRVHITAPVEVFRKGVEGLRRFLKVKG